MATSNDTPPFQQFSFPHVLILDIFMPGFIRIVAASEKLLFSKLNDFANLLCLLGILIYAAKQVSSYAHELINEYLSMSTLRSLGSTRP